MNKKELAAQVAQRCNLSASDAAAAVDATFDLISAALAEGEEVRLLGFGTFGVSQRAATTGRNPKTQEAIEIPASRQPKFKPGKALKDSVNV